MSRIALSRASLARALAPVAAIGVLSAVAAAESPNLVAAVNERIQRLVAPFNDAATELRLAFSALEIDPTKTIRFGANAFYRKKGPTNELKVDLKDVSYAYGDGSRPRVGFDVALKYDFRDLQADIDSSAQFASEYLAQIARQYGAKYGEALSLSSGLDRLEKDAAGHVTGFAMHVDVSIDPTKLPARTPIESTEFLAFSVRFEWTQSAVAIAGTFDFNPQWTYYREGRYGLRETIRGLLENDGATYDSLQSSLRWLDQFAARAVGLRR